MAVTGQRVSADYFPLYPTYIISRLQLSSSRVIRCDHSGLSMNYLRCQLVNLEYSTCL